MCRDLVAEQAAKRPRLESTADLPDPGQPAQSISSHRPVSSEGAALDWPANTGGSFKLQPALSQLQNLWQPAEPAKPAGPAVPAPPRGSAACLGPGHHLQLGLAGTSSASGEVLSSQSLHTGSTDQHQLSGVCSRGQHEGDPCCLFHPTPAGRSNAAQLSWP